MNHLFVIRSKALLMLAVFAANFYGVCQCAPLTHSPAVSAAHCPLCCKDLSHDQATGVRDTPPCKEGCHHTHSIKFNLQEKQISPSIGIHPPVAMILPVSMTAGDGLFMATSHPLLQKERYRRHIPPDRLALYQCFLL
ncbi:MAG TPA: hypothetical protein VGM30_20620 [Puia sp.]